MLGSIPLSPSRELVLCGAPGSSEGSGEPLVGSVITSVLDERSALPKLEQLELLNIAEECPVFTVEDTKLLLFSVCVKPSELVWASRDSKCCVSPGKRVSAWAGEGRNAWGLSGGSLGVECAAKEKDPLELEAASGVLGSGLTTVTGSAQEAEVDAGSKEPRSKESCRWMVRKWEFSEGVRGDVGGRCGSADDLSDWHT